MDGKDQVFQQDLSKEERPGAVFIIKLLMKNHVGVPDQERVISVMRKHLGEVDCFWHDEKGCGLAVNQYLSRFQDAAVPPQLMVTECTPFEGSDFSEFEKSQMWDCIEDRDRILEECKYHVIATDMLAGALPACDRADMDMDFLEALLELYPSCEAVYFYNSGKLFTAGRVRSYLTPRELRFIHLGVNVRFFHIEGTDDMIVDTLGMSTLYLPDLQYHFHGMDPNWVVNHAYNIASYLLEKDNPVKDGDTIDGLTEGQFDQRVQWKCIYENALIQPARQVIDIHMGEYAAGSRAGES